VLIADESGTWKLVPVAPNVVTEPGLVLYRFWAPLFYANVGRFLEEVSSVVRPMRSPVRWVVVDAEAITHVDYSAARALIALKKNPTEAGIELAFAWLPWDLRSEFDRHHLTETIGPARIFNRLHDAIGAFEGQGKPLERKTSEPVSDGGVHDSVGRVSE
jgi:sulfate permease, SulP family